MVHQNLLLGNFPQKEAASPQGWGVLQVAKWVAHLATWYHLNTLNISHAIQTCEVSFSTIRWCLIDAIRVIEFPSQCSSSKCNFTKSSHTKSNVRSQNLKKRHCCYSKTHIISASTKPPFFLQILSTLFTHLFHSETPTKGWNNPNPHNFWAL